MKLFKGNHSLVRLSQTSTFLLGSCQRDSPDTNSAHWSSSEVRHCPSDVRIEPRNVCGVYGQYAGCYVKLHKRAKIEFGEHRLTRKNVDVWDTVAGNICYRTLTIAPAITLVLFPSATPLDSPCASRANVSLPHCECASLFCLSINS